MTKMWVLLLAGTLAGLTGGDESLSATPAQRALNTSEYLAFDISSEAISTADPDPSPTRNGLRWTYFRLGWILLDQFEYLSESVECLIGTRQFLPRPSSHAPEILLYPEMNGLYVRHRVGHLGREGLDVDGEIDRFEPDDQEGCYVR